LGVVIAFAFIAFGFNKRL